MALNNNFKWLKDDIDSTLVIKIVSNKSSDDNYGVYFVYDILESDFDKIDVKFANIDDLTNLLSLGIVRFMNVVDNNDILDIPFRNLYKLYKCANVLGSEEAGRLVSFSELDSFSVIDGEMKDDLMVYSAVVDRVSEDMNEVMKIAYEFGNYGMQQKFDALSRINDINHKRLMEEKKNSVSK